MWVKDIGTSYILLYGNKTFLVHWIAAVNMFYLCFAINYMHKNLNSLYNSILYLFKSNFQLLFCLSSEAKVYKSQNEKFHGCEGRKLCQDHAALRGKIYSSNYLSIDFLYTPTFINKYLNCTHVRILYLQNKDIW